MDLSDDNKITEKIFKEGIYYEPHRDRFSIKVSRKIFEEFRHNTSSTLLINNMLIYRLN